MRIRLLLPISFFQTQANNVINVAGGERKKHFWWALVCSLSFTDAFLKRVTGLFDILVSELSHTNALDEFVCVNLIGKPRLPLSFYGTQKVKEIT